MGQPIQIRRRQAGLTLVELMCAIMVLLITALGAFSSEITSLNLARTARETQTISADLQAAMDRILIFTVPNIPLNFPEGQNIADFDNLHLSNESIVPTYPGGIAADPLTIRVTATWSDFAGRNRTLSLSSQRTR